jgi:transposase
MTFVGLDLHKRYVTVCALDSTGGVVGEVRRMPVSLEALGDFLAVLTGPVTIAMEATLYWQWLHDQLEALGHFVRVADARQVKLIWQTRSKTDPIDARKLAELVRVSYPRARSSRCVPLLTVPELGFSRTGRATRSTC